MPCRDGGPCDSETPYASAVLQNKIDDLTRMLCGLCKVLDLYANNAGHLSMRDMVHPMDIEKIPGIAKWWKEHQAVDKQRLEKAKQSALKKLTDDEKEALGIG